MHAACAVGDRTPLLVARGVGPDAVAHLAVGGGFALGGMRMSTRPAARHVVLERARTLPDWVRPHLELLICGLNPSLYAADTGVPFGRPGNRLWPALHAAGCAARDRDVRDALRCGVGFTDLVKRATATAAELGPSEYAAGLARVTWLIRQMQPRVTCFVGLEGYRRAQARTARPGWIEGGVGGRPAYLMPSSSGRNAHVSVADLASHLARAASL
jgi:TDG/mug DNA glycosylase family protein